MSGLKTTESKVMAIREAIIDGIGESGKEDEIMTLLGLYEQSKTNFSRMNRLLSLTLGGIDDQRAIPILMEVASNEDIDITIRTVAVEVLAKKQAPELVDYFIELLGDPTTKHRLNEFTLSLMGEIDNDRMILAFSFQGKSIPPGEHKLITLNLSYLNGKHNVSIKNMVVAGEGGKSLDYSYFDTNLQKETYRSK